MYNLAPSASCECPTSELPVEAAAGEGLAAVAGPSPALCQPRAGQRNRGPNFPNSSTSAQARSNSIKSQTASPASTSVQCEHPAADLRLTPPYQRPSARHRLRRLHRFPRPVGQQRLPFVAPAVRINVVANYFYSWDTARERGGWYPAQTSVPRSLPWAVPAQAPEAVCPPHRPLSLSAVWSLRSPDRWPAKASSHPALPDRLRAQHFASLRVLGHWQTCRQRPHSGHQHC